MRLLYSRVAKPHIGWSSVFSFNDPHGMCPECDGIGRSTQLNLDKFLDKTKSLNDGALQHPDYKVRSWRPWSTSAWATSRSASR